jgi:hypothetical protein
VYKSGFARWGHGAQHQRDARQVVAHVVPAGAVPLQGDVGPDDFELDRIDHEGDAQAHVRGLINPVFHGFRLQDFVKVGIAVRHPADEAFGQAAMELLGELFRLATTKHAYIVPICRHRWNPKGSQSRHRQETFGRNPSTQTWEASLLLPTLRRQILGWYFLTHTSPDDFITCIK